jgi:CheY-like chemotaxis protein
MIEPNSNLLPEQVNTLREVVAQFAAAPTEAALIARTREVVGQVRKNAAPLGNHAFRRIARSLHEFVHDFGRGTQPRSATALRSVQQATEFLARLLEPNLFAAGRNLPAGQVLALDDDADLRATVITALAAAGLRVTGCDSAEAALAALGAQRFDTIVADVRLPAMDGTAFCTHARELPAYRRTPILFLTVADTLDKRAETSLSGGNEFLGKPFNVFELALRVETWVVKQQLQLL